MTSLDNIIPLQKNDSFIVIDLKDTYFHITNKDTYHKYLCFALDNTTYQFRSLTFGLSTAPRVFTKCMAPVLAYLRLRRVTIFPYLDD